MKVAIVQRTKVKVVGSVLWVAYRVCVEYRVGDVVLANKKSKTSIFFFFFYLVIKSQVKFYLVLNPKSNLRFNFIKIEVFIFKIQKFRGFQVNFYFQEKIHFFFE